MVRIKKIISMIIDSNPFPKKIDWLKYDIPFKKIMIIVSCHGMNDSIYSNKNNWEIEN